MADPLVTNVASGTSALATTTATFGFTATPGRVLALLVAADDYFLGSTGSRTPPTGYTIPTGGAQETFLGHFYSHKVAATSETSVQYVIGSASPSCWIVLELGNVDTASAVGLDTSNGQLAQSSAMNYTTPAVTPSTGRRLAVATIGGSDGSRTISGLGTWTNGFVEAADVRTTPGSGTQDAQAVATLVLDGNGSSTISAGATFEPGGQNAQARTGIIVIYKGLAASAPPPGRSGLWVPRQAPQRAASW